MKIFHCTALFVILVGHVIASSDIVDTRFSDAVDQEQLNTAVEIWESRPSFMTHYDMAEYLVKKASPKFIAELAGRASSREHIVAAFYTSENEEKREEVFKKVSFEQFELADAALNSELACQPEHFLDLIGRITVPLYRDMAIDKSIDSLFKEKHRINCIDPLLNALDDKKDLKSVAIQRIFERGVYDNDENWTKHFYDHHAITSKDYAGALIWLVRAKRTKTPIFEFLFKEADQSDLLAILDNTDFKRLDPYYLHVFIRAIIEQISLAAKPAGSRRSSREKAKVGKEVFEKVTVGETEARGPSGLFAEYFAD